LTSFGAVMLIAVDIIAVPWKGLRAHRQRPHGCRATEQRDELAALCMTGKEHCEGRRGLGHDRTPVATGSPQPFRTLIRE
jgi:hypothetical protein